MATAHFATALKTEILTAIQAKLDAGTEGAVIQFYTGTMAATIDTAIGAQVLLGTLQMPSVCTDSGGSLTASALTIGAITQDSSADATGVATWARISSKSGSTLTPVVDVDVSNSGGTGAIKLNTINIVELGPILMTSLVISMP